MQDEPRDPGSMSAPPALQWGGRFDAPPDPALLAFGSSLDEDLVLASFDLRTSLAHVAALEGGGILDGAQAAELRAALGQVAREIADGSFAAFARSSRAEDIHGAIDARVRELASEAGGSLHAGRSRNDQVATTLALYVRDRAARGARATHVILRELLAQARTELRAGTPLAATTHWQPAQPVLLAFWLAALAEAFLRGLARFEQVAAEAARDCPLGSGACSGSSLPLDREAAAKLLGFARPSRNALDAVGDRDLALDLVQAVARALGTASRACEELVVWATPAYGYLRLGDAASTGSSSMPQKRNPDPFELIRAAAKRSAGELAAALGTVAGIGLSYHRDLQETKSIVLAASERGLAALEAFGRALAAVQWRREALAARAGEGFVVATDLADALIARGISAREAHAQVGALVAQAERAARSLDASDLATLAERTGLGAPLVAPLDPTASIAAKRTSGSTAPREIERTLAAIEAVLARAEGKSAG
ncbi:MAG: argininosuccinate lyase [Vulcanimicrobiaceae bacterium]